MVKQQCDDDKCDYNCIHIRNRKLSAPFLEGITINYSRAIKLTYFEKLTCKNQHNNILLFSSFVYAESRNGVVVWNTETGQIQHKESYSYNIF